MRSLLARVCILDLWELSGGYGASVEETLAQFAEVGFEEVARSFVDRSSALCFSLNMFSLLTIVNQLVS